MAQAPAGPNGAHAPQGMVSRVVGDLANYFKSPDKLSSIQTPQQTQQQPGPTSQPPEGGHQQQQQNKQPAGSTSAGATNDPETLQNPLDVYAGMFDNSPRKDKDGKEIATPEAPRYKLDGKTIKDAASKIDFTSSLPQELKDALQSGQPLDTATTLSLLQHATQAAYAAAMEHGSALTDRFVDMRLGYDKGQLPQEVNRLLARTQAISNPAIASNPALKEHYEFVTDRLHSKFPDQPPDWIAKQANQYFTDMANAVNPNAGQPQAPAEGQTVDGVAVKDGKVFDWQDYLKDSPR